MRRVHNSQFEVDPPWCLRPIKLMKQRSHISTFGQHSHQPKKSGNFHRVQPLYDAVEWSRARVALPWSRRPGKRGKETPGGYLRHGWLVTDELLFRRSSRRRITKQHWQVSATRQDCRRGARFTKYITTILRLSYDNAKVTIDLRRTSNLQNIIQKAQRFS